MSAPSLDSTNCGGISVEEIAKRLEIGRLAVYAMLEQGIIPASAWAGDGSSRATRMSNGSAPAGCDWRWT